MERVVSCSEELIREEHCSFRKGRVRIDQVFALKRYSNPSKHHIDETYSPQNDLTNTEQLCPQPNLDSH